MLIQGIVGAQKEAALAAKQLIVTVEEVVDTLDAPMNAIVLPHWIVTALAVGRRHRSADRRRIADVARFARAHARGARRDASDDRR